MDLDGRGGVEGLARVEGGRGNHNQHIACKNVFLIKGKIVASVPCVYKVVLIIIYSALKLQTIKNPHVNKSLNTKRQIISHEICLSDIKLKTVTLFYK